MKKKEIARKKIKNTTNICMQKFINKYISNIRILEDGECKNKELIRFHNCISYIKDAKFDISGWKLHEIPIFYAHCFWNENKEKAFDLAVWDIGEVIPRYLDSEANEQDASTIEEAIEKYDSTLF